MFLLDPYAVRKDPRVKLPRPFSRTCRSTAICLSFSTLAALFAAGAAHASLGGPYESIAKDGATLHAAIKMETRSAFEVHELTLPSGTQVREYATPAGLVFAVTWNGPALPDLSQTLGAYFPDYTVAARTNPNGHRHLHYATSHVVIDSGGRMRAFFGRAYLVGSLPADVSVTDLR
jgi:hypothetical protein